jgi:hypothetical protein
LTEVGPLMDWRIAASLAVVAVAVMAWMFWEYRKEK